MNVYIKGIEGAIVQKEKRSELDDFSRIFIVIFLVIVIYTWFYFTVMSRNN